MKRLFLTLLFSAASLPLFAQLYHAGEELDFRVSYRAKLFPNTEMGSVEVVTTQENLNGAPHYKVTGTARTLPTYRWFYNLEDIYRVWVDEKTLKPVRAESDLHEGDYTYKSLFSYDWPKMQVHNTWRSRQRPEKSRTLPLTNESMDAISLFFTLRASNTADFRPGVPRTLQMVLADTIRRIQYRYVGKEEKKIRNIGKFKTLKFTCQLGTSEGNSFKDGTVFTLWISDDQNKIPLCLESPVKVGSVNVYLSGYKGLKYPLTSLLK